jgi:hypothetical protein
LLAVTWLSIPIPALILVGSPLVALLGILLFVRAQKVQTRFACRACNYDLRGSMDSTCCPECGCVLDQAGVRAPGELRVNALQLALGLVMIVVGIVVFLLGGLPLMMMSF